MNPLADRHFFSGFGYIHQTVKALILIIIKRFPIQSPVSPDRKTPTVDDLMGHFSLSPESIKQGIVMMNLPGVNGICTRVLLIFGFFEPGIF